MKETMSNAILPNKNTMEFFQKGIVMSCNALEMLYVYLNEHYNVQFIYTYRLNQDILENFFFAIRSKGGLPDHSSPKQFKYRIRKYILGKF